MAPLAEMFTRVLAHRAAVRLAAFVVPLLTCALLATDRDALTLSTAALILVVWIVAAAATGDRWAGITAAGSSAAWFNFFLTEPYLTFRVADSADLEVVVLLLLIGILVTEVSLWGRRQQEHASRRSGYLDGILATARVAATGDSSGAAVADMVSRQVADVLGASRCHFVAGPRPDARMAVLGDDGTVTRGGAPLDVDRAGLPVDTETAIPATRGGRVLGHLIVTSASRVAYPTLEQRRVAVLLADQVATALAREDTEDAPR